MDDPAAGASTVDVPRRGFRPAAFGLALALVAALLAWADARLGWVAPAFDFVAHQFYEVPGLAAIRRPSQLALVRVHLLIAAGLAAVGLIAGPRLGRHGHRWWAVFVVAYVV